MEVEESRWYFNRTSRCH